MRADPSVDPNAELRTFEPLRVVLAIGSLLLAVLMSLHWVFAWSCRGRHRRDRRAGTCTGRATRRHEIPHLASPSHFPSM